MIIEYYNSNEMMNTCDNKQVSILRLDLNSFLSIINNKDFIKKKYRSDCRISTIQAKRPPHNSKHGSYQELFASLLWMYTYISLLRIWIAL